MRIIENSGDCLVQILALLSNQGSYPNGPSQLVIRCEQSLYDARPWLKCIRKLHRLTRIGIPISSCTRTVYRSEDDAATDHIVEPVYSVIGVISFPFSAFLFTILNVASTVAIVIHRAASARCCPGQILRMVVSVTEQEVNMRKDNGESEWLKLSSESGREKLVPSSKPEECMVRIEERRVIDETIGKELVRIVISSGIALDIPTYMQVSGREGR